MRIDGKEIIFEKFPSGETNFKVNIFNEDNRYNKVDLINRTLKEIFVISDGVFLDIGSNEIYIGNVELYTNDDLINFVLLMRTIRDEFIGVCRIDVAFLYLPYMRQDRVCNEGEPFSIKYVVDILKTAQIDTCAIIDPHSNVTSTLLDAEVINPFVKDETLFRDKPTLVIPDLGAIKRSEEFYKKYDNKLSGKVIFHKKRDLSNGNITSLKMLDVDTTNLKQFLIFDDICDGGATFLAIGNKLKEQFGEDIDLRLFVTHGLFTKGKEELNKMFSIVTSLHER